MNERNKYESTWWQVSVPPGWTVKKEKECATFSATPPVGVLQISSARKDTGTVRDADLRGFAVDRVGDTSGLLRVTCGEFTGFSAERELQGRFCREWWLRSGNTMLYVTYSVPLKAKNLENEATGSILDSAAVKN